MPDNLTSACWLLGVECNMHTKVFMLSPCNFGVPQARDRLWFPSFPREKLLALNFSETEADALLSNIMSRLVGSKMASLHEYLLPDWDPLVQAAASQPLQKDTRSVKFDAVWPLKHLAELEKLGLKWWETRYPEHETRKQYPMLSTISYREFDIMHKHGVAQYPERDQRLVEVSQSLHRTRVRRGQVGAITPMLKYYVTDRRRFVCGAEELRLRSIHFERPTRMTRFPEGLIRSLAGNAFEGSCCAATVFASCLLLARGVAGRALGAQVPRSLVSPERVSGDGGEFASDHMCEDTLMREDVDLDIQRVWGR